jgi:hypothetical protein
VRRDANSSRNEAKFEFERFMNLASKSIVITVGLIVVFAIGWMLRTRYETYRIRHNSEVHATNATKNHLGDLAAALEGLEESRGAVFNGSSDTNFVITGREMYSLLSVDVDNLDFARPTAEMRRRRAFYDEWGNELHGRLSLHAGRMHVALWSSGANQVDEQGKGDDILVEDDANVGKTSS